VATGNTADESGNNSASCGGALLLRPLFLAVLLGVSFHCLLSMSSGMNYVTPRGVSVACRLFVMSGIVALQFRTLRLLRLAIIHQGDALHLGLETVRHLAAALGKLDHDLLVQPDVHFCRAIESAGIAEFLRQLFSGAKAAV
jgi:hypothetical protein